MLGIGMIVLAFPLILISSNLAAGVLLMGATAYRLPKKFADVSLTVRWGIFLFFSSMILSVFVALKFGALALLCGFLVGGKTAWNLFLGNIFGWLTGIDPDRWVDFFSLFVIGIGGFVVFLGCLGFVVKLSSGTVSVGDLASSPFPQASQGQWLMLTTILGGLGIAGLGFGIRMRLRWAGLLGLCLSFLALLQKLNQVFQETGGDLTLLPLKITTHFLDLGMTWFFFFGFYSLFSPVLISGKVRNPEALEGQMKEAGERLEETRRRLAQAETSAL